MLESLVNSFTDRLCPRSRRTSFALNKLDVNLEPYLRRRGGFFVEAGSNDGVRQSNTLYFEKYMGWRGLLIEAIPSLAEECRKNRPRCRVENCALVSAQYTASTVEMNYCNLMSLVKGGLSSDVAEAAHLEEGSRFLCKGEVPYTVEVPARTLSDVLDQYHVSHVDFLSLDVEGYEPQVLRGLCFERHAPTWLLVEVRDHSALAQILFPRYRVAAILSQDASYCDILYTLQG